MPAEGSNTLAPRILQKNKPAIASTRVTNELVDAINACGQILTGEADNPQIAGRIVRVRVAGNLAGGGKYYGNFRTFPEGKLTKTGNLSDHDLGSNGRKCFIMNAAERGLSSHDLTEHVAGPAQMKDFIGVLLPQFDDDVVWVEIGGYDIFNCET